MLEEQEKADTANEARENPVVRSRMDIGQEDNIFITRGSVTERLSQKEVSIGSYMPSAACHSLFA